MSDRIREQISKVFEKLEDKLINDGLKKEEIEELKIDIELSLKNKKVNDLYKVLKEAEEKIQKRGKVKGKSSLSTDMLSDFSGNSMSIDYEVSTEEGGRSENIEEMVGGGSVEQQNPDLVNITESAVVSYASKAKEEEEGFSYKTEIENIYNTNGMDANPTEVYTAVKNFEEEKKAEMKYRATGVRDKDYS